VENGPRDLSRPLNLFAGVALVLADEQIAPLLKTASFRLERIVSTGHATPPGQWYDQARDEWVLVLRGSAGLLFEGEHAPLTLHAGDYLTIPAHQRHRVEWTDPTEPTVWLALHYCA
jgi:cupin 2 domain-containing protein